MYRTRNADPYCNKCSLSTGKSIHSCSNVAFKRVILCIYSDYPSVAEESTEIPLTPDRSRRNAGWFLRLLLDDIFDKDPEFPEIYKPISNYTLFSNSIRCNPVRDRNKTVIRQKHRDACSSWIRLDMTDVPSNTPIIAAGSEIFKTFFGSLKGGIKENRNKILYSKLTGNRPIIVSNNPVVGSNCIQGNIISYTNKRDGSRVPKEVEYKLTYELLDPIYYLRKDYLLAKKYVLESLQSKNKT